MNFWVITCGIRAQGSNTRPECGSTCINKTVYLKQVYWFLLFFWITLQRTFSYLTASMEGLEEYADEESPFTERSNSKREPIQEEITNNSFELLQMVKELRTEMETDKKENERILRAQKELNDILMEIFQNEENHKWTESEDMPYQHKDKKTK